MNLRPIDKKRKKVRENVPKIERQKEKESKRLWTQDRLTKGESK